MTTNMESNLASKDTLTDTVPAFLLEVRARERPADPMISCLVPAFNEEGNILPMLHTLHAMLTEQGLRHELIVIDDGSRDATVERVMSVIDQLPVTLIQLSRNFGKEVALSAGIDLASGDVAVLLDSDFQHPPELVPSFLAQWRRGYDMVFAVRSDRNDESFIKRAVTHVFYMLLNFGERNKIHIINLEKSLPMFQDAAKFVRQLSSKRGTILMVGTKRQARETVAAEAQRAGVPYVDQRWLGGMLTNFKTVKTSIKRLKEMKAQQEAGLDTISKKEQLTFKREIEKLEKDIGGIQDMATLPDAIFVIDVGYHKIAISEAKKLGIPLIGVVDTNHSPEGIDYVIPGNDDSAKAVALYARGIADAIIDGRANAVNDVLKAVAAAEGEDEFVEVQEASA